MTRPRDRKGQIALGGRRTGPVTGYNMFAQYATADVATADVSKQAGNGLRRGTHGKPFPCAVCWLREQKNYERKNKERTCFATSPPINLTPYPRKSQVMAYRI